MRKQITISVDAEMSDNITKAHERFLASKRKVSRNDVIVQLIADGFDVWTRNVEADMQLLETVARIADQMVKQDRMLRSILLTLAEDDEEEYQRAMTKIDTMEKPNV